MRRGEEKKMRPKRSLIKDDKGFTGLEAAIVLTAFIVVAAVFSYMVLGAGFFSTEKAKAVVHSGVEQATSSAELTGDVVGHGWNVSGGNYVCTDPTNTTHVTVVEFQVQLTAGQHPLDMDKVVISFSDEDTYVPEVTYDSNVTSTCTNLAENQWNYTLVTEETGSANMLDPHEKMNVIVGLTGGVAKYKTFSIDFKPAQGGAITLTKTVPGTIDKTMVLT